MVNKENKAELRKIRATRSIDGRSVIDEGLSPGEQVITAGQFKVQPGTLVTTAVASSDQTQAKVTSEWARESPRRSSAIRSARR